MATNIGTGPQDIPLNQFLGEMAFMDVKPIYGCKVGLNTAGNNTITNNVTLPFNNVIWQYGVEFNTSTYKFTAPVSGIYSISANVYKNGSGTPATIELYNDTLGQELAQARGSNSGDITLNLTSSEYLNVGDEIRVRGQGSWFAYENTNWAKYSSLSIFYMGTAYQIPPAS